MHEMEVVSAVQAALTDKVGQKRWDLWFGAGGSRLAWNGETLTILAANPFSLEFVRINFAGPLQQACGEVLGRPVALAFQLAHQADPPAPRNASTATAAKHSAAPRRDAATSADRPSADAANIVAQEPDAAAEKSAAGHVRAPRQFATFDSLVIGESNKVAVTAARMLLEQPGCFSSLFVYGPTGVGKTHLVESVWTAVRRRPGAPRVVYLSAEQFTTYFVEAARGSGLPNFRRKYRGAALLVLDDVQFFANKKQTLVEVLYTVDSLLRDGQQVIFAADRSPQDLAMLGGELVARFTAGAVCSIDLPEETMRRELLRQRARTLRMDVPEEVVTLVAERLGATARELNGALHRLLATSRALGEPITTTLAETALTDLLLHAAPPVRLADVERAVCEIFGIDAQTLQSDRRQSQVSHPRMLAMWLARKHTRSALSEIGDYFGGRTHATVISAQKKVNLWLANAHPVDLAGRPLPTPEIIRRLEQHLQKRLG